MSLPGLLFALLLTAFVLMWIVTPMLQRQRSTPSEDVLLDKQRERLLFYYERVLRNIHDLDEDHALGKTDAAEYQQEREEWAQRGVEVLQALDTLPKRQVIAATPAEDHAVDSAIDDAIETAIQRHRQRNTE